MSTLIDLNQSRIQVDERLPSLQDLLKWHPSLIELSQYSLIGGGKALRPALLMWSYSQFSKQKTSVPTFVVDWAVALEMIHTYSLIHDDLPAMDNDDFRRGKPTLHKLHGDGAAVLAGDALLTGAFEVLAQSDTSPALSLKAVALLSAAAGAGGMIGGQWRDMFEEEAADSSINLNQLERVHCEKTGALMACSLEMGALAGEVTDDQLASIRAWGLKLGLLFQVVDDILDATGDRATLGKSPGKDSASGKRTYIKLLGIEGAKLKATGLREELFESAPFPDAESVKHLLSLVTERKN